MGIGLALAAAQGVFYPKTPLLPNCKLLRTEIKFASQYLAGETSFHPRLNSAASS